MRQLRCVLFIIGLVLPCQLARADSILPAIGLGAASAGAGAGTLGFTIADLVQVRRHRLSKKAGIAEIVTMLPAISIGAATAGLTLPNAWRRGQTAPILSDKGMLQTGRPAIDGLSTRQSSASGSTRRFRPRGRRAC